MSTTKTPQKLRLQKPFLKWVGGKTQLLDRLVKHIPQNIKNYHEPFLGGGSVLFAVLSLQKSVQCRRIHITEKIYASDANKYLIMVYKHIQHKFQRAELHKHIEEIIAEYDSIIKTTEINRKPTNIEQAKTSKESYYYWLRHQFNTMKDSMPHTRQSALFIILNKLCFRGVYREGPNGFNVPYGHYKKTPAMLDQQELDIIGELIQTVEFRHQDYSEAMNQVVPGDFVYIDPPYAPETSKSFVGYTANGFDISQHKNLFKRIVELENAGVNVTMSNANVEMVQSNFNTDSFMSEDVVAKRAIHSKNPGVKTTELIISNHPRYPCV
tara:strand:+ start:2925 stop:3899 length:975 start_codon:yes stop_codon:yes gene_type:complete